MKGRVPTRHGRTTPFKLKNNYVLASRCTCVARRPHRAAENLLDNQGQQFSKKFPLELDCSHRGCKARDGGPGGEPGCGRPYLRLQTASGPPGATGAPPVALGARLEFPNMDQTNMEEEEVEEEEEGLIGALSGNALPTIILPVPGSASKWGRCVMCLSFFRRLSGVRISFLVLAL